MESIPSNFAVNEHDYTALEVPLEAIKQEFEELDDTEDIQEICPDTDHVRRIPVVLRDNKPKLRVRKEKPHPRSLLQVPPSPPKQLKQSKQSLLLPRPIMPKLQFSVPIPPNSKVEPLPTMPKLQFSLPVPPSSEPPKNCKGVFVVQDIKVCTMYVPKSEDGSAPKMTLPIGAFTSSPIAKSTPAKPPMVIPTKPSSSSFSTTPSVELTSTEKIYKRRKLPEEPHTITSPITFTNKKDSFKSTNSLIEDVQVLLTNMLPLCWFSAVEKDGINVMLLSFGKEKAIQRRVFVSLAGDVEITVHCKPMHESLFSEVLKQAGERVSLTAASIKNFSDRVLKLVHIVRDFHVCVGLEWMNPPQEVMQLGNVILDENPYQESRFSETLRSKSCLRLVDAGKRKCAECCKAYCSATKYAKSGTKSTQTPPQKKRRSTSSSTDDDDSLQLSTDNHKSSSKSRESSPVKKRKSVSKNKKKQSQ